ncbi:YesL family protein [Paenibacillus sp. BSR1-1]|uniref:YesL family protein n=1 Tax=Paenibacillus sp. BSR1-1 TaxID=3020845 RepID=UPI0025AF067F|nr:YesL family protein [Paenibacillus sp. BSR1-1]MDN3017462.1 YesL family protein [Paenibacillus sp. BSR1-1]
MESNRMIGKINHFAEKVMRIAQFQLLWIVFSICGGVVLGMMPATIGLFTVMRKWLQGNEDNQSYVRIYWATFRKEFWKANIIGFILTIIGFMIYMNFTLIRFTHGIAYWFLLIFVFMMTILFVILLFYIFPVYVHFENKFNKYFSISILIGISSPFHTMLMIIGFSLVYLLLLWVPGFIPFLSIGLFSLISMYIAMKAFTSMEGKKEHASEENKSLMKGGFHNGFKPAANKNTRVETLNR